MCLGTFSRLRRSLATSTLSAAVRILAERFLLYRKAISCKAKKSHTTSSQYEIPIYFIIFFSIQYINSGITPFLPHKISASPVSLFPPLYPIPPSSAPATNATNASGTSTYFPSTRNHAPIFFSRPVFTASSANSLSATQKNMIAASIAPSGQT